MNFAGRFKLLIYILITPYLAIISCNSPQKNTDSIEHSGGCAMCKPENQPENEQN